MDFFSIARQGNIGILTMNRPPMNNFNLQMYRELQESIAAINADDDIWAAIFRAEGKNFCTGNDVKEFINLTDQKSAAAYADKVSIAVGSVGACRVPLVGAINGMALGTGLGLASLCDVLVADDRAKFGIPEARVGIVGMACFIRRMLPEKLHRYMAFSGEMMTAEEMKAFGAVLKVVPAERLLDEAIKVAERFLMNPPLVLRGFKASMNANENASLGEKYAVEASYTAKLCTTEDFREAVNSFFEKRKPAFKAR